MNKWLEKREKAMRWLLNEFPYSIGSFKPLKVGVIHDLKLVDAKDKPSMLWIRRTPRWQKNLANCLIPH